MTGAFGGGRRGGTYWRRWECRDRLYGDFDGRDKVGGGKGGVRAIDGGDEEEGGALGVMVHEVERHEEIVGCFEHRAFVFRFPV